MNPAIARLVGWTLVWLPVCFAVWYFSAPMLAAVMGGVLGWLVSATFPMPVTMTRTGALIDLLLQVPAAMVNGGGQGHMAATISLDTLIYSCGIPLFLALMLALPEVGRRWREIGGGLLVLFGYELVALYVSACYNTVEMLHMIGADTRWLFGLPWNPHLNLLAQTAFALVLPSALAVFLWASFNLAVLTEAMPSARRRFIPDE